MYSVGICSIFLRVDRSTNEMHKPRAFFAIDVFDKKYVFIYLSIEPSPLNIYLKSEDADVKR